MKKYVADTHSLIWFITKDIEKLGRSALEAFFNADRGEGIIFIPTIVLLEALGICEDKKVDIQFMRVLEFL